jgi:hypothetical protein
MFYSFFAFQFFAPMGVLWLNKKPAFDWQTRAFENSILECRLENSSHVAGGPRDAVPNRHLALLAHGAQVMFNKRGVHFLLNAHNSTPSCLFCQIIINSVKLCGLYLIGGIPRF